MKSEHPWKQFAASGEKLRADRKAARRRKQKEYEREPDGRHAQWERNAYRIKHGIPLDAPPYTRSKSR